MGVFLALNSANTTATTWQPNNAVIRHFEFDWTSFPGSFRFPVRSTVNEGQSSGTLPSSDRKISFHIRDFSGNEFSLRLYLKQSPQWIVMVVKRLSHKSTHTCTPGRPPTHSLHGAATSHISKKGYTSLLLTGLLIDPNRATQPHTALNRATYIVYIR